jgi:transposase
VAGNVDVSLGPIDDLELQIARLTVELKRQGADHRYIPLLVSAPGFGWIKRVQLRLGDRRHRALRVAHQAVRLHRPVLTRDPVGQHRPARPDLKHGRRYLRWALFEAAPNACRHPLYAERHQHTKRRVGRQRGPRVAQIELSRKLTEAIWHMLTRNEPFARMSGSSWNFVGDPRG